MSTRCWEKNCDKPGTYVQGTKVILNGEDTDLNIEGACDEHQAMQKDIVDRLRAYGYVVFYYYERLD